MSRVVSRIRVGRLVTLCGAMLLCLSFAAPVFACPMCKFASESTARQPTAYMYSILFMMGMPAALLSGFGIGFYSLSRKSARMQQESFEAWERSLEDDCASDPTADEAA
jgi:hypothetical protein